MDSLSSSWRVSRRRCTQAGARLQWWAGGRSDSGGAGRMGIGPEVVAAVGTRGLEGVGLGDRRRMAVEAIEGEERGLKEEDLRNRPSPGMARRMSGLGRHSRLLRAGWQRRRPREEGSSLCTGSPRELREPQDCRPGVRSRARPDRPVVAQRLSRRRWKTGSCLSLPGSLRLASHESSWKSKCRANALCCPAGTRNP